MIYYDRIDISKGIDLAKSNSCKECMICHYWFFNHGFKLQDSVCNGCNDLIILSVNISNIAIITVKNVDCRCTIHNISKSEAINLFKKSVLFRLFKAISSLLFLFSIYKMTDNISIYKSLNINIGTIMKNSEMLKSVPDHLKAKKMYKHTVKKIV